MHSAGLTRWVFGGFSPVSFESLQSKSLSREAWAWSFTAKAMWVFLKKMWYPTTMGFPTKMINYGVFWGYHHFRKPPCSKQIGAKVGLVARSISILHVSSRTTSFAFGSPGHTDSAAHLGLHDSRLRENMSQMPSNCKLCFWICLCWWFQWYQNKEAILWPVWTEGWTNLPTQNGKIASTTFYPNVSFQRFRGAQLHSCSRESSDLWGDSNFFPWEISPCFQRLVEKICGQKSDLPKAHGGNNWRLGMIWVCTPLFSVNSGKSSQIYRIFPNESLEKWPPGCLMQ